MAPPEKKQKRDFPNWIYYAGGFVTFYVLSPVLVRLIFRNGVPDGLLPVMGVVYAPLQFLFENVSWFRQFYDWLGKLMGF